MNIKEDDRVSAVALVVESGGAEVDVAEEAEEVAEVAAEAARPAQRR
jgi:hypothetical protein